MKKLSLFLTLLIAVSNLYAQSTKIWVTVNDHNHLELLESRYKLGKVKKALPDTRSEKLQNVYEIEITENYSHVMDIIKRSEGLVNPVIIEEFTTLYEPNDYNIRFSVDYALDLINAQDAWNITKGNKMIKLGILDSNYDPDHEELTGAYSHMSDDINGTNYNHGTAVAATAAGNTNNGVGKSAIGNECDMMLYGMGYNHLLQATYAGARVVNLSWASGCYYNSYYQDVINEVYNNGTVIIAAAGNGPTCGGADNFVYPASFNNVISVSSIGPNDNHERFIGNPSSTHQHNDSVDLVAPGYDVALTIANNVYITGNGTSFAAPYVVGTVGLMLSVNPCLSPAEVQQILKATAVSVDSLNPNYEGELGAGRLDAHAAVQMAKDLIPIDFDVIVKDETCVYGTTGITIQLNHANVHDFNLQWSDGSKQWSRNDLNPGNYNFTISSPGGCSINHEVTFLPTGPHFDYVNSVFVDDENFTLIDSNNDGVINIRGALVIESNVEYNLNGYNLKFSGSSDLPAHYPNSGIVIKDGAQVLIENSNLNSIEECTNNWGGIELWSISNNIAVVTISNSTIKNAAMGVSNISKYAYNQEVEEYGGQIKMVNSTVINSKIGVNIIETIGQSKMHIIGNCTFVNEENIMSPVFVNLIGAEHVSIKNNNFIGSETVESTERGTAVKAYNSSINSLNNKPAIQNLTFNNKFNNLFKGLDLINNTKRTLDLKIYDDLFTNVEMCITINGKYNGAISFNEFNISKGSTYFEAYGIKTSGENNLNIENNLFSSEESENNFGLISKSNTMSKGGIRLNKFEGNLVNGINFIGENNFNEVSCNVFDITGQYDWFIYKNDEGQLGSLNVVEELNINTFSDSNNVVLNLKNDIHNQLFHYKDAYAYMPMEISESISFESIHIEIDRIEYCYNGMNNNHQGEDNLSVEESEIIQENESISFYPNPSNGIINISNNSESKIEQVNILSMEGKMIETIILNQQQSIDLSGYSAGTYILALQLDSSVKTERVVIL